MFFSTALFNPDVRNLKITPLCQPQHYFFN